MTGRSPSLGGERRILAWPAIIEPSRNLVYDRGGRRQRDRTGRFFVLVDELDIQRAQGCPGLVEQDLELAL